MKSILWSAATVICVAGCRPNVPPPPAPPGEVQVSSAPPPVEVDIQTPMPGPDYIWIGGAWVWGPGGWGWSRGHWEHPPHPGAVWAPDRYEERHGAHVFVRGRWK